MDKIISQGGAHVVVCDGRQHWVQTRDGVRRRDGDCWCPKKTLEQEARDLEAGAIRGSAAGSYELFPR